MKLNKTEVVILWIVGAFVVLKVLSAYGLTGNSNPTGVQYVTGGASDASDGASILNSAISALGGYTEDYSGY